MATTYDDAHWPNHWYYANTASWGEGLDLGTWKAIHNFEGQWTERVLLQCSSAKELITIYKAIHNKGIDIQGHTTAVSMHSDYVDLERHEPGNQ